MKASLFRTWLLKLLKLDHKLFFFTDVTSLWHKPWVCPLEEPQLDLLVPVKQRLQKTWDVVLGNMWLSSTAQIRWTSEDWAVFTKVNKRENKKKSLREAG